MLRNEKGFTFYEAIISLNVLILFCGVIGPSMTSLFVKKQEALLLKDAEDLLTDSVHSYFLNREKFFEGEVSKNGRRYEINLKNSAKSTIEICAKWTVRFKESEICEEISE